MSNESKSNITRERVPSAVDDSLIVYGTQGGFDKAGKYYTCSSDGIRPTEAALNALNVAVDSDDGWWWLRQMNVKSGVLLGKEKPLVVFVVHKRIHGLKHYDDYDGVTSGVYTCPKEYKAGFRGDDKIIWMEGKRRLKSIIKADDPINAVARKLCKHFNENQNLKAFSYYLSRGASIAVPIAMSSVA